MSVPSAALQGGQLGETTVSSETRPEDNDEVCGSNGTRNGSRDDIDLDLPEGCGLAVAEGGGVLSPLSGAYLLIVLSEPMSDQHKSKMIQKLRQGKILTSQLKVKS